MFPARRGAGLPRTAGGRLVEFRSCCENFPQSYQSGPDTGFHRAQWLAGLAGDLGMSQALEKCHIEALVLLSRERRQRLANLFQPSLALGFVLEVTVEGDSNIFNVCLRTPLAE